MAECIIVGNNISDDINNNESNLLFNNDGTFKYPENVTVSKNVTSLIDNQKCFRGHSEVVSINFEEGTDLGTLSSNCFRDCTNLKRVDLSNAYSSSAGGRLYLGDNAFNGCINLNEIIIDERTWFYYNNGQYAFANCTSLTDDNAYQILKTGAGAGGVPLFSPNYLFQNCTGLKNMIIPEGYTGITTTGIFQGCSNLESITFPSTMETIDGNKFFGGCNKLKSIIFQSKITSSYYFEPINSNNFFYNLVALENVVLPNGWNISLSISDGTSLYSNILTHDGMISMFNNLATVENATLMLGATNLSRLTEEEKAIATSKGWTLA